MYRLFSPILLYLSFYGYSETTLSTKIFFSTYRCLFLTQTQSDQNPHTKSAIFSTFRFTFLGPLVDRMYNTYFFVRPGPCLIEWYGCCCFDLLSPVRMRLCCPRWVWDSNANNLSGFIAYSALEGSMDGHCSASF